MLYFEYEKYKKKYIKVQEAYEALLTERENIITSKTGFERIDDIEKSIRALKQSLIDRKKVLDSKKEDVLNSHSVEDIVYRMRYIERVKVNRIAKCIHYSETQTYRILNKIDENLETVRNSHYGRI